MMERNPFDLDPVLENSVDIQELFDNSTQVNDETLEKLILDIKSNDIVQSVASSEDLTTLVNAAPVTVQAQPVPDQSLIAQLSSFDNLEFVLNPEQVSSCLQSVRETLHSTGSAGSDDLDHSSSGSYVDSEASDQDLSSLVTPPPSPMDVEYVPRPRGRPGRKPSAGGPVKKKRQPEKGTREYFEKRARNNLAIRKCREKAKLKQVEMEERMQYLESENVQLKGKLDAMSKQLELLKNFVISNGANLPENIAKVAKS
ncbi:CCAAT/enhancer-binding protein beta-like [Saccostrea cucullata]|uniref:CCAAT/enhancer-binding protein beta-like n=1 Tax=Saccostrea cuccullata TaxID=36930 RepID=UPI002ED05D96